MEKDDKIEIKPFLQIPHMCPQCSNFPLEYEDYGYERVVFCSRCDYETTVDL